MKGKRKNKYPLFTYLCLLVAVAAMCTGVTFSRYVSVSGGGAKVGVYPFECSFSIDEISSTAFSNFGYSSSGSGDDGVVMNPPRSISFTARNYGLGDNPAVSDLDLQSTFRLSAPVEFMANMAFQIASVNNGGTVTPVTPQYILNEIVGAAENGTGSVDTSDFADYGEIPGCDEEKLSVSGGFGESAGRITAAALGDDGKAGTVIVLDKETRENMAYSVAFCRGVLIKVNDGTGEKEINDMSAPVYYADCVTNVEYYTLDITLPSMFLPGGEAQERQYVFYFTMINKMTGGEFDETYSDFATQNGSIIKGCHYNVNGVAITDSNGASLGTATVKVVKKGTDTAYFIGEEECTVTDDGFAVCGEKQFSIANLSNPAYNPTNDQTNYVIGNALGKLFSVDVKILFVQASES